MKAQNEVTNEKANQVIESYNLIAKNSANLEKAKQKNDLEFSETIGDIVKQSETIFPQIKGKKFNGEKIRVLIFFQNGQSFTELIFKNYQGKVETLCKTSADKIFNTFSTLKGRGKMNILVEFNGKKITVKSGRVYHMNRKNMHKGMSALIALQSYAYIK